MTSGGGGAVLVVAVRRGLVALSPNGLLIAAGTRAGPGLPALSMRSNPLNVGLRPCVAVTAAISVVL